jgi:hypothetical protein
MQTLALAIAIAFLAFGSGIVGLRLRAWLPERHAPDRAREMIGSMTGLLGLLLALVLGTLVGSSYTLYATQKAELDTLRAHPAARRGARGLGPRSEARARRAACRGQAELRQGLGRGK